MHLTEFINQTNAAKESHELMAVYLAFLKNFGVDSFSICQSSLGGRADEKRLTLIEHPESAQESKQYIDQSLISPLISRRLFVREDGADGGVTGSDGNLINESSESRKYNEIVLSIYYPLGKTIEVHLSNSAGEIEWDKNTTHIMYAAANQFLIIYSQLIEPELSGNNSSVTIFTLREREVLLWLARGKTKGEISQILSVSESAIKKHCESIFRKLDVNNLQLAIAKAIRLGFIHPY